MRLGEEYAELFDVAVIPNVRCPVALEPDSPQMQDAITFEDGCAVVKPAAGDVHEGGAEVARVATGRPA
jgi:hypothetical protein